MATDPSLGIPSSLGIRLMAKLENNPVGLGEPRLLKVGKTRELDLKPQFGHNMPKVQ